MKGRTKALVDLDGKPLIRHVADTLELLFEEIFIVARSPRGLSELGYRITLDRYEHRSSLTGIHAALDGADTDHVFITSCDAPFLQSTVVNLLLEQLHTKADVIVPIRDEWYFYPLCAIYSKACLPVVEAHLEAGNLQTVAIFEELQVATVPLEAIMPFDPTLQTLFNVNTPEDLATAHALLSDS